jgi:hypothetical protein
MSRKKPEPEKEAPSRRLEDLGEDSFWRRRREERATREAREGAKREREERQG